MAAPEVFVDSGYLLALEIADDQHHADALRHWRDLAARRRSLVTTSYVFDEVVTFLNSRGLHARAVQRGRNLLDSPLMRLVHVDEPLFFEGWSYFQHREDKDYSLTDCISFIVMQRSGITTALAFDRHFAQAGFVIEP
jgi:predicted nucleic acid-binding protein